MNGPHLPDVLESRYRVEETLGEGGMGIVYRAVQVDLGRPVAIKLPTVASVEDAARFVREARILAGLEHPNIVRGYDAGQEAGQLYIVLELILGHTLTALDGGHPLAVAESVALVGQVLAGRTPFGAPDTAAVLAGHLNDEPPALSLSRAGVPSGLEAVLIRGLAKDPLRRWHSADAFAQAIAHGAGVVPAGPEHHVEALPALVPCGDGRLAMPRPRRFR